jgi:methyltransferase OMS1
VQPLSKGCAWNQDVEGMVAAAGLRVAARERHVAGTIVLLVAEKP